MNATSISAAALSCALGAYTVCAAVTVTNVTASQRIANPKYVDIAYDLLSATAGIYEVVVEVSTNAGAAYVVGNSTNMTGALGPNVSTGTEKQVAWFAHYTGGDLPAGSFPSTCVRVTANSDMAYISAGAFMMGSNSFADGLGNDPTAAAPRHQVTLAAFYMDKCEVTSQQWKDVFVWAKTSGYEFAFITDPTGKARTHPVQYCDWYNVVKWCNARSQKEGLTPCYYTDAYQTGVYRAGTLNLSNACVNWAASGYRLPTEAEWEKAARGGATAMRFPWSDAYTITNSKARANYDSYPFMYDYDLGLDGYNQQFDNDTPYTSPVGYFPANAYGVYDMAGNVAEWCWDWYSSTYYASSPASNPPGPETGTSRIVRGGSWSGYANECRVADRSDSKTPTTKNNYLGFRCVRR